MSRGLDVIIVDDEPAVCEYVFEIVKKFYTWGEVRGFTDVEEALAYCNNQQTGVAIFILDVFLGKMTGFSFLDKVTAKFPMAYEDTIMITGNADDEVVNRCVSLDITHLLEKPIKAYALQLAVRTIVVKYIKFAKKILKDPGFAESLEEY